MRRKRAASKSARNSAGRGAVRSFISSLALKVVMALCTALITSGILLFLREAGAEAIFRSLGFALAPAVVWAGILVVILWQSRLKSVLRNWNYWLGALVLTSAAVGTMALFHPEITVGDVSLADSKVTLAGSAGLFIRGTSYEWLRLLGLYSLGTVFLIPGQSWLFARRLISLTWQVGHNLAIILGIGLWHAVKAIPPAAAALAHFVQERAAALRQPEAVATEGATEKKPRKRPAVVKEPQPSPQPEELPAETALKTGRKKAPPRTSEPSAEGEFVRHAAKHELPSMDILDEAPKTSFAQANDDERARLIEEALGSYGVDVKVQQINPGPSVTQFGVEPGWVRKYKKVVEKDQNGKPRIDKNGVPKTRLEEVSKTRVKVERITSLANDLALALAVSDIRIEAPMPGKALVGIEVPNVSTSIVSMRSVIESPAFHKLAAKSKLSLALGQGAGGEPAAGDLAKMPHLLIAGATGSGKTVCLNSIVSCLLTQTTPAEVRMLLIDPKRVEMVTFADVPHLITPVVVEADKAVDSLRRLTTEMDVRYHKFAAAGVRNIDAYNRSPKVTEPMPYIVAVIDELADLMMTTPDVVEPLICRLAQLARATGIHLIIATQRPSVDVITGLIKANFPTRISFAVVSSIDSRTILDATGAEKLLGRGDMLYLPPDASKPKRIRGCFVSDEEMDRLVGFWKRWAEKHFPPEADRVGQEFAAIPVERLDIDPLLDKARQLCNETSNVSASFLQRRLHIGHQRAARLLEQLEEEGLLDSEEFDDSEKLWEGEP